jgi:hypothetical protein
MALKRQRVFQVTCDMSIEELTRAGSSINLTIKQDEKLGEIQFGRGSLMWAGKRKGHDKLKRLPRNQFAETMNGIAGGAKVKMPD